MDRTFKLMIVFTLVNGLVHQREIIAIYSIMAI